MMNDKEMTRRHYTRLLEKTQQPSLTYDEMVTIVEYILSVKDRYGKYGDAFDIRKSLSKLNIGYENYCNSAVVLEHFALDEYKMGLSSYGAKSGFKVAFPR